MTAVTITDYSLITRKVSPDKVVDEPTQVQALLTNLSGYYVPEPGQRKPGFCQIATLESLTPQC